MRKFPALHTISAIFRIISWIVGLLTIFLIVVTLLGKFEVPTFGALGKYAAAAAILLLRVRPQHLHHEACLAGLALVVSVQLANVIERDVVVGEQAAVQYQVLFADECSQGQSREALREELEHSVHAHVSCL